MNLGLLMTASRSCRLRERFCPTTISSPPALTGLRYWISTVASSPTSPASIGASDAQAKASSDSQARAGDSSNVQAKAVKKRMMFKKLSETEGTVALKETLEMFKKEDATAFSKSDLVRWAKLLYKKGKIYHAAQIFGWMHGNKESFTRSETVVYVDLLLKTKGFDAADYYYWRMPYKQRSDKAYHTLIKYYEEMRNPEHIFATVRFPSSDEKWRDDQNKELTREPPTPLHDDEEDPNIRLEKAVKAYMDKIGFPKEEKKRPLSKRMIRKLYKTLEEFPSVGI